ncbi:MAG: cyclic nucleotide-binding domain-containing protein [Hyphomicrobiaceae bacterium]|nr:cyclic nucleotide-binding domain-containing protein [Hyphomicrobiaceae bacterium]
MDPHDWQLVRSTPLFGAIGRETADRLLDGNGPRVYDRGLLLFEQGTPATCFYVVLDGWVKIYRTTPDGQETVVATFRRGETFAEAAIFMGGHYPVSAETVTVCRLLRINGASLRRAIHNEPDLALAMLASSSHHLKSLVEQIEQMKRMTGPQRLADFLLRLCSSPSGSCQINLPYEKALIANRLGMKPESLSRALAKLKPLGINVDRDTVNVDDVAKIAQFIEDTRDDEYI